MAYDLGDIVTLGVTVKDSSGNAANATSMALTITLPDATTASVTPTNPTTGSYQGTYTPATAGRYGVRWVASGTNAGVYTDVFEVYDTTTLPVVSLADLKRELNITTTTSDDELRYYLARATSVLEEHAGRAFARQTRVDTFDVHRTDTTVLLRPPVISVTSVVQDGVTIASTAYNFNPRNGILELDGVTFGESEVGSVVVTYVAGYTAPPAGLVQALLMQVRHMWETQRTTPRASRDDDWQPGSTYMIPNRVAEALRPYMMPGAAA